MTREDLENYPRAFITPAIAAVVTGQDPQTIRLQARQRPDLLGYPVNVCKTRVRIPKVPFMEYWFGSPEGNAT
jgi:hypothetical protein